jgi:general secretion pathway protein I
MLSGAPLPDDLPDDLVERRDAGFTLIETLAALAILSIALGVLLAVFGDGIRRQGRAEQLAMATLQAQSLLARVGINIPLKAGVATGTLARGLHWRLQVDHYGDAGDRKAWPSEAYQVVVEVSSDNGNASEPLVKLETLRLGPKERGK